MTLSVKKARTSNIAPHIEDMTRIERMLRDAKRVLVVSHLDPDGDAIGSQLAFGAYLADCDKTVFMLRDAETPGKYTFLANTDKIQDSATMPDDFAVDAVVVLECPNRARIGRSAKYLQPGVKVVNIDHHPDAEALGDINWFDTGMSSVGEMICEYFRHVDYEVSPAVAEALYTAMLTDTGRFRYASTTQRTMELAGTLITAGADPQKICERVYYNMPVPALRLHGLVLKDIEFHLDNRVCFVAMSRDILAQSGAKSSDTEGLVDYTLYGESVCVGAFFKEAGDNQTKVSMRSRDSVNVSKIASSLGGGGHFNAAGCLIKKNMADAKAHILGLLTEAINDRP